jgi:hypothetical protein
MTKNLFQLIPKDTAPSAKRIFSDRYLFQLIPKDTTISAKHDSSRLDNTHAIYIHRCQLFQRRYHSIDHPNHP